MKNRIPGLKARGLRLLFDVSFLLFSLVSLAGFLRRLKQARDPRRLILDRIGLFERNWLARVSSKSPIWIHAVSVGEVQAVQKLVRDLENRFPDSEVLLSTVTPTGQEIARAVVKTRENVFYFPLDVSWVTDRVVRKLRPRLVLLTETEIWPNFLLSLRRAGVPVGIVNGRLSEKSFRRYRRVRFWIQPVLSSTSFFLARTQEDARRFTELVPSREKIQVTGNMKFDVADPEEIARHDFGREWGFAENDRVVIAGSTHRGEEDLLLQVFSKLRQDWSSLKLVLAPRHIERAGEIIRLARRFGFRATLSSESSRIPEARFDVLVLDQLGILKRLYALGEVVCMGGSWVRHGGQNPLEPAIYKRPIVFGPHTFNFEDIYRELLQKGAGILAVSREELFRSIVSLLSNRANRELLGERIYAFVKSSRGATERNLRFIEDFLSEHVSSLVPVKSRFADQARDYLISIITGEPKAVPSKALAVFLRIASTFYSGAVALRNWLYEKKILKQIRLPFPVVSVGNLTWGGTGKTPLVELLLEKVMVREKKALLLSRGYGADEWKQVASHFPDVVQALGAHRERMAVALARRKSFDIALCDDGFQHRSLFRDWEILVIDALDPFGNGALLPRGILREPLSSLGRADTICLTHCDQVPKEKCDALEEELRRLTGASVIVRTVHEPITFWRPSSQETVGLDALEGRRAIAFCSIGSPVSFQKVLERLRIRVEEWVSYEDHHFFSSEEIQRIALAKRDRGAEVVITTEKDYFRQPSLLTSFLDPYVLKIKLRILFGEEELEARLASLLKIEFRRVGVYV